METLVIGLDGGEWDVIEPMIEEGQLPHLADLKESGVSGPLESIRPPVSPPAWNSIQTGMNPGKHGIFDFSDFDEKYRRTSTNASDRCAVPFWTILNDYGTTTGLFKVPFTYPPEDVDGYIVSGFPTPNGTDDFVRPMSLQEMTGPAKDLFEDKSLYTGGNQEKFKENLIKVAEHQTELFIELIESHETEFGMSVYDGSDRIQHYFWKYMDESHPRYEPDSPHTGAIEQYYKIVDDGIGRILERTGDDCDVLVISDHGFGPLSYDIYIDEWLAQEGFLTRNNQNKARQTSTDVALLALKSGWQLVKQAGLQDTVKSIVPASWFKTGKSLEHDSHRGIAWDETVAFFSTLSGQGIFINLEDRFAKGRVTGEEYDKVIEQVRESLLSIRHPETNEQLVEEVIRSDEAYSGWVVDNAPDLIVRTDPEYTLKNGSSDELVRSSKQFDQDRSGDHRKKGMFIASGPSFDSGTIENAGILDIAPTLLYLHECPIPDSIDGEVLHEIITEDLKENNPINHTSKYGEFSGERREWSENEEEALEERLSNMGYLN
ncbi:alkaline phosphatase family protein [Haloferax sp. ATB1]|uniref:alkaline phosphatase family protein n=1 Tax=Haloferax sp. ATB1 TaxID=1508454 RepID=UPI0005B230E0|nr:alkaline phosphatase family protein [Haloferax sp. ATB1]